MKKLFLIMIPLFFMSCMDKDEAYDQVRKTCPTCTVEYLEDISYESTHMFYVVDTLSGACRIERYDDQARHKVDLIKTCR